MKKRMLATILVLAMVFVLAACGNGGSQSSPPATSTAPGGTQYADTIDIITEGSFAAIGPTLTGVTALFNRMVNILVYDRLIMRTPAGDYIPQLATSWDLSSDMLTYTFKLRDDVNFHNGYKFTAQSVVDTVVTAHENAGSMASDSWRLVESANAVDENTVEIVLNAVNVEFLYYLTMPGAGIVNKAAIDANPVEGAWVGTGAYAVTELVAGDFATLTRNDDYWGDFQPTRVLNLRWVPEATARTIMMENGETHMCLNIQPEEIPKFAADTANYTVYTKLGNLACSLDFNMNDPITGDKNFRLAVAHALNRAEIAEVASGQFGIPEETGTFWGHSTEFRNNDIPIIPFDLDKAKEYLAASSYDGGEVELISGTPNHNRAAEMIQEQLGKIDINVRLFQTDPGTLSPYVTYDNNQAQMVHFVNPFTATAASARSVLYPGGASNKASYNNPAVNELLDRAPSVADRGEREALYKEIQQLVADDLAFININYEVRNVVAVAAIGGIDTDPEQNHDFRGIYLEVNN